MTFTLLMLLLISVVFNAYQWYRWHYYRTQPAGLHSHTAFFEAQKKEEPRS